MDTKQIKISSIPSKEDKPLLWGFWNDLLFFVYSTVRRDNTIFKTRKVPNIKNKTK